ncbi:hypothetical protein HPGCJGGD_2564 [Methylobacterium haplocladii]|nr:hypothetical protein HPGCJGGD_2564 [Methylobacterium haplocladii]
MSRTLLAKSSSTLGLVRLASEDRLLSETIDPLLVAEIVTAPPASTVFVVPVLSMVARALALTMLPVSAKPIA